MAGVKKYSRRWIYLKKIKLETLKKRIENLEYKLWLYPENIKTYKNKTNKDLTNADRFILMVAMQEKEIEEFDIQKLVKKWEKDYIKMTELYYKFKKEFSENF